MKTGIHQLSMSEYLKLDALSSGVAHTILSASPMHAKFAQINERTATSEMDIGTFAHAMLLEGGTDALVIVDADDWRTKAAKEQRDAARAEGKLPILAHKLEAVEAMVKAARLYVAGSELSGIFSEGQPEVTMVWTETTDDGEVLCKARADYLRNDRRICLSYKTTAGSANPDMWIRAQLPNYDLATAFYARGVLAVCPDVEETRVVHLVQEQSSPYACSLIALSPALEDLAERKLDRALGIWAQCQATGQYPAYPTRICYAEPKSWQLQEFDEQEANREQLSADELKNGVPL